MGAFNGLVSIQINQKIVIFAYLDEKRVKNDLNMI